MTQISHALSLIKKFHALAQALYESPDEVAAHVNWQAWIDETEGYLTLYQKEDIQNP